jgi:wobble nucleotide-excising tRNase
MSSISKIDKISSIGKFRDYTAAGMVSFAKLTLIYADNGCGKTTLTSILRSLQSNDGKIIQKRISDGAAIPQAVIIQILDSAGVKTTNSFGKNGWKNTMPDFEIFDTHFVNQNIYSGFEISDEHKKGLHQFVIGAQGVKIKNRIAINKDAKQKKKLELDEFEKKIISKTGNGLNESIFKDFLRIKSDDAKDIDDRIKKAEKTKSDADSQKAINKYADLPSLELWVKPLNFESVSDDLKKTTKSINDSTLKKLFTKHIEELNSNNLHNPEDWLQNGYDYLEHKLEHTDSIEEIDCPFCQQPFNSKIQILKSYEQIFNDEFNSYIGKLEKHLSAISKVNIDLLISKKESSKKQYTERTQFWKEYVEEELPRFVMITNSKKLRESYTDLKSAIETKIRNPSKALKDRTVIEFEIMWKEVNANIKRSNEGFAIYNSKIKTYKSKLKNPATALSELQQLLRIKSRFKTEINYLCSEWNRVAKENRTLEEEYTQLSLAEELESNKFITKYADKINYYLKEVFKTSFEIKNMMHGARKGKSVHAKVDYQLLLNGRPVSFDSGDSFSVEDCLSEGDKSTLAFSFFLSKLEIDPNLANKILVFDDPLSSFDTNRRHATVKLISDISKQIKQAIVLSHNEGFLWDLYKNYDASLRKSLRINQDFTTNASYIEPLDIEFLVQNEYFVNIAKLEKWQKKPDIKLKEETIGLIRNVLESHLKFKFHRQLRHLPASQQTLGICIKELESSAVIFRDTRPKTTTISELNKLNALSCRPHHGGSNPDPSDYGIDLKTISDTELSKFISEVLDLLDNKL